MRVREGELFWFRFHDRKRRAWTVLLSTPECSDELKHKGNPLAGCCVYDTRTIYVSLEETRAAQDATLLHEMLHAALRDAGIPESKEEVVVEALDASILPILLRMGFRIPPRPRGYQSMRRRAMRRAVLSCAA